MKKGKINWKFKDDIGSFIWINPDSLNELYFPICNEAGMMSCLTPKLHGDSKSDQDHFLLTPVSINDLHNTKSARNFWLYIHGYGAWSATGNSTRQNSYCFDDSIKIERRIEAGLLWHKMILEDKTTGIRSEILNFIPANDHKMEIMQVKIINISNGIKTITPTSSIPLYCRSAENIRDHRHVTSLINRIKTVEYGMIVKPVIIFDERGHRMNKTSYYIIGIEGDGTLPVGHFPITSDFIGNSGSYEWPEAIVKNISPIKYNEQYTDGKEYTGALRFKDRILKPGEMAEYIIIMGISPGTDESTRIFSEYNSSKKIENTLKENNDYWIEKSKAAVFESGIPDFTNWMRWVGIQPLLRKIYGCSFLPYHDYGKGGRGWRDLWQDCLSLIIQVPDEVRSILINNFSGVRIDGTNATIIGNKQGEFIADRNNIARVWMDHGSWPYLTIMFYIDQTGDVDILFERVPYFRDVRLKRATENDNEWDDLKGNNLKIADESVYYGTVLEHMIIQHLVIFFNVGEHNIIRLEGGDWNDTIDMASNKGESVALTALYGGNLSGLSLLLKSLSERIKMTEVFVEMKILLDTIFSKYDYQDISYKKNLLNTYFNISNGKISGKKFKISLAELANDLQIKGEWIKTYIREKEWIILPDGNGFFNGYYNNEGQRVDGIIEDGVRMNLTGQVFTTMSGIATDIQALASYNSCKKHLKDPWNGGYRLNTPLGNNMLNFGRGFAFSYGEKENGSVFSHMVVMYINALYKRGFVNEGYEVFNSLYNLSNDSKKSCIYPGIPEYFNPEGKGMYPYLTGSASWLVLTMLTEIYGVKGELGNFVLEPKLVKMQFNSRKEVKVSTRFAGRIIKILYKNPGLIDYSKYSIKKVSINSRFIRYQYINEKKIKITRKEFFKNTSANKENKIIITLKKFQ